jgi:hypothetical protein
MKTRKQKPFAVVTSGGVKGKLYRTKLRPFEATKYLDAAALRRAAKATIEIGTLEVPGVTVTVAADIRKGMITRLRPALCDGCGGGRKVPRRRQILKLASAKIEALGLEPLALPVAISARRVITLPIPIIPIGPIIIIVIIDVGGDNGVCITIIVNGRSCWFCSDGYSGCSPL